jgi:WD40 repeat protein/serine/threonine protein kinase
MDAQRWQQLDRLLDDVLDQPQHERRAFITRVCGEDEELRRDLESLVEAAENAEDFIDTPAGPSLSKAFDVPLGDHLIGARVGAYRLTKLLGTGGMGAVYLATRADDYRKEVAVKLTSPVFKNETNAAVFKRERQILARLEHPHIARLLDGGSTENGVPFLVMEYVDGLPLTTYCERNNLNIDKRLRLFLDICGAVAFAHRKLVIHRDLKPNNILVTAEGVPKLLDFGIAKLVQPDPEETAEAVTIGAGVLTPEYASPEQVLGGDITTASDVYSLGVVLYELLTGERPFSMRNRSLPEIIEAVEKGEATPPSVTAQHNDEPKLARLLVGDLDAIVLKALAKEPGERYGTVEELSEDLGRFLEDVPIHARRPTFSYRAWKFIRRYKVQFAAASVFLFLLVGWLITAVFQARTARETARTTRREAYAAEMVLAAQAWEDANLVRLRELVEKQVPQPGEDDLRGFEWYLLKNFSQPKALLKTFRHPDVVWSVAFSPDGKTLATGGNEGIVRLWDVPSGQKRAETIPVGSAWRIRFFPDGTKFAVVGSTRVDTVVRIFDTASGKEVFSLNGHGGRVRGLDISPDGKRIATGSRDGTIRIWNAETGAEETQIPFQRGEVFFVCFSPDGKTLAAAGSQLISFHEVGSWRQTAKTATNPDLQEFGDVWSGTFTPDGKLFIGGGFEGAMLIVDPLTGILRKRFATHKGPIKAVFVTSGGRVLSASWDQTIKVTNLETGRVTDELHGHASQIHDMAFTDDGALMATAAADFSSCLWRLSEVLDSGPYNENPVIACDLSADGRKLLTVHPQGDLTFFKLTDLATGNVELRTPPDNGAPVIRLSPDNRLFARLTASGELIMNEAATGAVIRRFKLFPGTGFDLCFSPDGKVLAVTGPDGSVKLIESATGRETATLSGHSKLLKKVVFSPDGTRLATAGLDSVVKIWDRATGRELFSLRDHVKPIEALAFSPDGKKLASGGGDDIIRVWDATKGALLAKYTGSSGSVSALAFSPDGKRLASASELNVIHLWDTATGQQVLAFTAHEKLIRGLNFTPDGQALFSYGSESRVKLWRAARN